MYHYVNTLRSLTKNKIKYGKIFIIKATHCGTFELNVSKFNSYSLKI